MQFKSLAEWKEVLVLHTQKKKSMFPVVSVMKVK
jgi:hypothetical protein